MMTDVEETNILIDEVSNHIAFEQLSSYSPRSDELALHDFDLAPRKTKLSPWLQR